MTLGTFRYLTYHLSCSTVIIHNASKICIVYPVKQIIISVKTYQCDQVYLIKQLSIFKYFKISMNICYLMSTSLVSVFKVLQNTCENI